MLNRIPPKKLIYSFMALAILLAVGGFVTQTLKIVFNIITIVGGLIGVLRPRLMYELQEESRKNPSMIKPISSEKTHIYFGYIGGVTLLIIGIGNLVFNWNL